MGQLGTYIAATDGILRTDNDNPTIGLLICKTNSTLSVKRIGWSLWR
ncbi:PDDEXK nuclease domain-containing protein [Mediterraneibacter sp.]